MDGRCIVIATTRPNIGIWSRTRTILAARGERAPFRAPHSTTSLTGLLAELALACGGVLLISEVVEFGVPELRKLGQTWKAMMREHRPDLVYGIQWRERLMPYEMRALETLPPIDEYIYVPETSRGGFEVVEGTEGDEGHA